MAIKIIADSCCDLSAEMIKNMKVEMTPLTLTLGDKN
jgi:fatty acid-binding protein DegV